MALTSPGVEVTVIDQSQYLPAATSSIPLVVFATAQDKVNPNGTGIAAGTTAANAGKLFLVTSQRDLTTIYGTPKFYTTSDGTPIQGYELNEYGLLAAYSALNVSNQCYCLRADVNLASLVASAGRPTGAPADGAYWLNTTTSAWGIYEWDALKQLFVKQNPIVLTDASNLSGGAPQQSIGNIGDYAVVTVEPNTALPPSDSNGTYYYKNSDNIWVHVGSAAWVQNFPCVTATHQVTSLTATNTFSITLKDFTGDENVTRDSTAVITVPSFPNNTPSGVADAINDLNWYSVTAAAVDDRLSIYLNDADNSGLTITAGTGTVLTDLGIVADTYYSAQCFYGTAAQAPLWGTGQDQPRPSGSVWIKVGAAGYGMVPAMSRYNGTSGSWVAKTVNLYTNDLTALYNLDPTGGQAIPEGTIYGQYDFNGQDLTAPVYFWERVATGPTIVVGDNIGPFDFSGGANVLTVYASTANSTDWGTEYTVTLPSSSSVTVEQFVTAWSGAGIPYTTATKTIDGAIQITHTLGGAIRISDIDSTTGVSNGCLMAAGFVVGETEFVKTGYMVNTVFSSVAQTSVVPSGGSAATFDIQNMGSYYRVNSISSGGTGYHLDDVITISGADLGGSTGNNLKLVVTEISGSAITKVTIEQTSLAPQTAFEAMLSNWAAFSYTPNAGAPTEIPDNYTNWFYAVNDQVDIMVNTSTGWQGYLNVKYNSNGFPLPTGTPVTDPNGPIVSASKPTTQSNGSDLEYGDLWLDTSDIENYPMLYRYQSVNSKKTWVLIDKTDQTSGTGMLFADARWSTNQDSINPANDPIPTIVSLLTSDNLDLDAPDSNNYPVGMLLWNTRRSGNNVKQWRNDYFTPVNFPDQSSYPYITGTWVSSSGLKLDGSAYMGRQAQRNMVVKSLRSVLDTNTAIRDEDNNFNLICTPGYPEVQQNMVGLNLARGQTSYILGDTPMRLPDDATQIQAWATSQPAAGGPFRDTYLGLFYPSGLANDLSGNQVAVPATHMMLSTFLRNDQVAYPWFAAAGTRRGLIQNATGIGYIDSATGEFQLIKTRLGIRDVLYTNFINPLVYFTGNGLLNYGNKTSYNSQSALDRTNVARLVAYIRRQLTIAARPFVFEPNDALTRQQIAGVVQTLMVDLVAKRGIYDYLVVCDDSNNTPARIDRNELWVDVAIEPVKAAEFIYIPVRVLNTGEIKNK